MTKYGSRRTTYNGVTYASKAEALRAEELDAAVTAGEVSWWIGQPKFRLGCPENVYVPDFLVAEQIGQIYDIQVEEVKGHDYGPFIADAIDGSVVAHLQADEHVRILLGGRHPAQRAQDLHQGLRADLGRSNRAAGQREGRPIALAQPHPSVQSPDDHHAPTQRSAHLLLCITHTACKPGRHAHVLDTPARKCMLANGEQHGLRSMVPTRDQAAGAYSDCSRFLAFSRQRVSTPCPLSAPPHAS